MAHRGRETADAVLALALACGATAEQAAQKAGVSARTVHRRLAEPAFQRRLQAAKAEMIRRPAAILTAAMMEAAKTLLALQQGPAPPTVRLGAARAVLEFGPKLREDADTEERLSALEQHVAEISQS
jgi:hypothetical protein